MKIYYLGVEGGATKSTAILADAKGNIVKERDGKMLNYHSIGKEMFQKNLTDLLRPLVKTPVDGHIHAVFGLAGLDTEKDKVFYKKTITSAFPQITQCAVVNDAKIALEAKCPGVKNRILIIAGTGSSVYGESGDQTAKSIGWDFILGDEGSSYAVGLRIMKAAMQSWDGRSKKTILEKLVLQKTGTKTMEEFFSKVYEEVSKRKTNLKHYIASFSPLINEGVLAKDWASLAIRDEAAQELIRGVEAVVKRLHLQDEPFCIGFIGSGWKTPGLKENVQVEIKNECSQADFSSNEDNTGVYGAILLAKSLSTKGSSERVLKSDI